MDSPSTNDGILDWLIWAILFLVSAFLTLWNKVITGRLSKVEKKTSTNVDVIHAVQLSISQRFAEHEKEERDRDEAHSREVREEFKELRAHVEKGHREILKKIGKLNGGPND